jgi:hypothetical protein
LLAISTYDVCQILSGNDGWPLRSWKIPDYSIHGVMFVGGYNMVACTTSHGIMSVWAPMDGARLASVDMNSKIDCVAATTDATKLVTTDNDGNVWLWEGDALPWYSLMLFRFDGQNFATMTRAFRVAARTFLLCCLRHRREGGGVLEGVPRDMRQLILVELSRALIGPHPEIKNT